MTSIDRSTLCGRCSTAKVFNHPAPAPVRIVRGHNLPGSHEPARVLTDVLETTERTYLRPANRRHDESP